MPRKGSSPLDIAHAKAMKKSNKRKSGGDRKWGRNLKKCSNYRARVGKPAGPGQDGQHKH